MTLVRRAPAGAPLLVGRLVFTPGRRRSPPALTLYVWCPYCRRTHCHGWPDAEARLSAVTHRVAHCDDSSPWRAGGDLFGSIGRPAKTSLFDKRAGDVK